MAKIEPAFHSKVTRAPALFHTVVEPRPERTRIISSYKWCCGSSFLRGALSHTSHTFGAGAAPRPGLEVHGAEIGNILGADDIETFPMDEAQIGRILFGLELVCHFL